jgi:hypothetical protein
MINEHHKIQRLEHKIPRKSLGVNNVDHLRPNNSVATGRCGILIWAMPLSIETTKVHPRATHSHINHFSKWHYLKAGPIATRSSCAFLSSTITLVWENYSTFTSIPTSSLVSISSSSSRGKPLKLHALFKKGTPFPGEKVHELGLSEAYI